MIFVTAADIVDSASAILAYVEDVDERRFLDDLKPQDAVIRRIEIIGEAAGRLSAAFREARPSIPWRQIRAMRNRMIHVYDDIDMNMVWRTARDDIPALLLEMSRLVPVEPEEHRRD